MDFDVVVGDGDFGVSMWCVVYVIFELFDIVYGMLFGVFVVFGVVLCCVIVGSFGLFYVIVLLCVLCWLVDFVELLLCDWVVVFCVVVDVIGEFGGV